LCRSEFKRQPEAPAYYETTGESLKEVLHHDSSSNSEKNGRVVEATYIRAVKALHVGGTTPLTAGLLANDKELLFPQ
jgi:hypothetical protein